MSPLDRIAFDFISRLRDCRAKEVFASDLAKTIDQFGFDLSVIGRLPIAGDTLKPNVLHSTYPSRWAAHYHSCGYEKIDPVIRHLRAAARPRIWSDIPAEKGALPWRMMGEAREHGLGDGVSIPIVTGHGLRAHVTFSTSNGEFRNDAVQALHLIGVFAHHCIQSITEETEASERVWPNLTPREHECLKWMAAGKSNWDTGQILSISARTVKFHLDSVARKLGTRAVRAQMIAEAFRRSLID